MRSARKYDIGWFRSTGRAAPAAVRGCAAKLSSVVQSHDRLLHVLEGLGQLGDLVRRQPRGRVGRQIILRVIAFLGGLGQLVGQVIRPLVCAAVGNGLVAVGLGVGQFLLRLLQISLRLGKLFLVLASSVWVCFFAVRLALWSSASLAMRSFTPNELQRRRRAPPEWP